MTIAPELQPGSPEFEAESQALSDYLFGELSDEERDKFEDRLIDDDAFFARMQPMLAFWTSNEALPAELEALSDAEDRYSISRRKAKKYLWRACQVAAVLVIAFIGEPYAIEQVAGVPPFDPGPFRRAAAESTKSIPAPARIASATVESHPKRTVVIAEAPIVSVPRDTAAERRAQTAADEPIAYTNGAREVLIASTKDFTPPTVPIKVLSWAPEDTIGLREGRDRTGGVPSGGAQASGQQTSRLARGLGWLGKLWPWGH